jgi:predicted NUDIX family phosphoesterase/dephospho-CoA kinase
MEEHVLLPGIKKPLDVRSQFRGEFLRVAEQVLRNEGRPMSARELVHWGLDHGLFSKRREGKTPHQTMKAKLSVHIRRHGERSPFVRTAPGRFFLRELLEEDQLSYLAPPWRPPPTGEKVIVFATHHLARVGRFQGIQRVHWQATAKVVLSAASCQAMERMQAEQDDEHKQVLTYILVRRGTQVLAYKRGVYNRVEDMLRGSHCLGFGGHLAASDRDLFSRDEIGLYESAVRELSEELKLPEADRRRLAGREGLSIVGLLNDDSSAVGRRHFAVLMQYEVSDDIAWKAPERGENSITQLRWLDTADPAGIRLPVFEYWSQLCLREFFPQCAEHQASYLIRRKSRLRPPHVLCVVGHVGSGKTEATKLLHKEFGYEEVNSGRVIADLMNVRPIPETKREEFQAKALKFIRTQTGPRRLAKALLDAAGATGSPRVLIDGIRQPETLRYVRTLAGTTKVAVLLVMTPPDIAFEFYRRRGAKDASIEDYLRVRDSPVEANVGDLVREADAVLYNWVGRFDYRTALRSLMKELGVSRVHRPTGTAPDVALARSGSR